MKFNTLLEDILTEHVMERNQQGGFQRGDRVKFKKGWEKHEYFLNKGQSLLDTIRSCSDPNFDLNLRISEIITMRPDTAQSVGPGKSASIVLADIYITYAPGLYRSPMTVPIDVLEVQDDGINTEPVPDSLRRKSRVHGPESSKTAKDKDIENNLQNKDVKNSFAAKTQDDTKPSKGWKSLSTK